MILNARTGELILEQGTASDCEVLEYLDAPFTLLKGTEQHFTLQTFRKMFVLYPSLTAINGWAENFLEQSTRLKPRLQVVGAVASPSDLAKDQSFQSLELAKRVTVKLSEMTSTHLESADITDAPELLGLMSAAEDSIGRVTMVTIVFEDKPDCSVFSDVDLLGVALGGIHDLDMIRLETIMHLRISMPGASYVYVHEYANEDRTGIDKSRTTETHFQKAKAEITLIEAIRAVLLSMNLDDEDIYLEQKAYLDDLFSEVADHAIDLTGGMTPLIERNITVSEPLSPENNS
ncbi:hypothetical protein [Pseudomonas putida]|uniref:Uncharacterized protein n=1 Tax=Pseudomonas putida TaxID=303 RepID=A0A8I1EB35_PSEPU|nr:hypothetical protein [Pseudomonas putida]MBI6882376.1 hypothetical protein [Pseudomonas putida]